MQFASWKHTFECFCSNIRWPSVAYHKLVLYSTAVTTTISIAPGNNMTITSNRNKCTRRWLDLNHVYPFHPWMMTHGSLKWEPKKQELVVKRVKVARAVTKNGEMICKYGRQFIKWIGSIGKKLLYSWGPKSPKGQWVGCMTVEENSSNLFEHNLKTWIFILQPTTSAHPAMFVADTPISTTSWLQSKPVAEKQRLLETATLSMSQKFGECASVSWINNIPLFTFSSFHFVESKRWILIFWDFWTMNQNQNYIYIWVCIYTYVFMYESRWLATPTRWRFGRGHDKPIHGSGDRHLLSRWYTEVCTQFQLILDSISIATHPEIGKQFFTAIWLWCWDGKYRCGQTIS